MSETTTTTETTEVFSPSIFGPNNAGLAVGYAAYSVGPYTIDGTPPVAVTASGNSSIVWNSATNMLDIAAGLDASVYTVTLTASNGVEPDGTFTVTLYVVEPTYYKYYINVDDQQRVTEGWSTGPNASRDTTGATLATDKGINYQFTLFGVENPALVDADGVSLYAWNGTDVVTRASDDVTADDTAAQNTASINAQIDALKAELADTDYQTLKFVEGQLTQDEFTPIEAQRQAWREQINTLQAQLGVEG